MSLVCNHRYVGNYKHAARTLGQQCPYPELYDELRARANDVSGGAADPLPVDEHGACLFHSRELDWKRRHDLPGHFRTLVALLNGADGLETFDFAEFVFVGGQDENAPIHLANLTFRQTAQFTSAVFLDSLTMEHVELRRGIVLKDTSFARDLKLLDTSTHGFDLSGATVNGSAWFTRVQFLDYALFIDARFKGQTSGTVVKFEDCRFEGITDFSEAQFALGPESSVGFWKVRFEDFTNFQGTRFQCHLEFDEALFGYTTEFVDTSFESVGSSARYRGAAVELNRIDVPSGATLTFQSTDAAHKLFDHDVQISFRNEPEGTIRFENVNFHLIGAESRLRLMRLAKLGRVQIGAGCIKYRFQTPVRTIAVRESNAPLVVELCQTFTNYFTQSNGLNLGFEVVERDKSKISFFYFTDEDISEEVFLDRLAHTERQMWTLLSTPEARPLLLETGTVEQLATNQSTIINTVDGLSALLGTFFRVGARIALGAWKAADTKSLLSAIRFNEDGADDRAASLHQVIAAKYTGNALLSINRRQNDLLLPMVEDVRQLPAKKVRVLYLAANSLANPLDLEREYAALQQLARECGTLEVTPVWAATIDGLTREMLADPPEVVHFSGHGLTAGIVLRDAAGEEKVVSGGALASFFALFSESLHCVVLNSCFSEAQARLIRQHVPHVVGMADQMRDGSAIAFSLGFYRALGAGRDIPLAFKFGLAQIGLEGEWGQDIPLLL